MVKNIDTIYGTVVRKTNKYMGTVKLPGRLSIDKAKKLEHIRIKTYDRHFAEELRAIPKQFPDLDRLHPFYRALLEAYAPIDKIKEEIGRIRAIMKIMASIRDEALFQITKAKALADLKRVRRMYLGRTWDVLEKNKKTFDFLRKLHRVVRRFPRVDFNAKTVVLAGFPNAGKSTLLKALTGSEPEIAPYPFTTQDIRIGHFEHRWRKVQVIDTPGILDRDPSEMNPVELKAVAALKHLADVIVFIFDPFQDPAMQRDLLTKVEHLIRAPVIRVVNKVDLLEDPVSAKREFGADMVVSAQKGTGIEELRSKIIEELGWSHGRRD